MKLSSETFKNLKILIVGDVMVDSYIVGKIDRISPEAPVPVVNVSKREERLGGAANVAMNVKSLYATPVLCSVVGKDKMGNRLKELLEEQKLSSEGIVTSSYRPTTVKHRVMAGSHHVIRIDDETDQPVKGDIAQQLIDKLKKIIPTVDVVIIEDYDKGVLNKEVIDAIRTTARSSQVPVTVDPKKRNFDLYTDFDLFKPNFKELQEGIGKSIDINNSSEVESGVRKLFEKMKCKSVMVTLSASGVMSMDNNIIYHSPAHFREISDVSGAGDTVIAVAAAALALKFSLKVITELANLAGGLVCEHQGVVPVDLSDLVKEYNSR